MLSRYLLGLNKPIYSIAGPSGMVSAMSDLLNSSGVSDLVYAYQTYFQTPGVAEKEFDVEASIRFRAECLV